MTDWRECLVVRDRENTLWGRDPWTTNDPHQRRWIAVGSAGLGADGCYEDEMERRFGPITPVLDADGLPVVRTVGDLTARHIGRRVRVDGFEGEFVAFVALFDGIVTVEVLTDDDLSAPRRCTIDTPVEVVA